MINSCVEIVTGKSWDMTADHMPEECPKLKILQEEIHMEYKKAGDHIEAGTSQ